MRVTLEGRRGSWPVVLIALIALILGACGDRAGWQRLWWTPDQLGEQLFASGDYLEAAASFEDPLRKGTALYRAERFDAALDQFARLDTAESWFARGNALAHLERYEEAVGAYEQALQIRPGYPEAEENIDYLQPFLPLEFEGGVSGVVGRDAAADDVVFDADADRLAEQGIDTDTEEGGMLSEGQIAEMWLQQVDASPAAFLRAKFHYQVEVGAGDGEGEGSP